MKQTKRQIRRKTAQYGYFHSKGIWYELTQLEQDKTLLEKVIKYGISYSWTIPKMLIALQNFEVMYELDRLIQKVKNKYLSQDIDFYFATDNEKLIVKNMSIASNNIFIAPLAKTNAKEILAKYATILTPS